MRQLSVTLTCPPIDSEHIVDALYMHVPFCFHKCHYCDFYSIADHGLAEGDKQEPFTRGLIAELEYWASELKLYPRTIFVGGGTPSLLRVELWQQILEAMHGLDILNRCEEFTIEANPETVTPELAKTLVEGGVNRISIGAQSFDQDMLKALERWHDPASVPKAMSLFRDAGITNLNLDLIFGVPGQTLAIWKSDLAKAIELRPNHLSTYGLTFEPETPLGVKLKLGRVSAIDEETELAMYQSLIDTLAEHGYEQYEISNFAQPNHECQHNLTYWHGGDYLGVGPSASSYLNGERWKNKPSLRNYLLSPPGNPPRLDMEQLSEHDRIGERLMLALRTLQGITLSEIQEDLATHRYRKQAIQDMIEQDYLEQTPTHLRLTRQGLPVADAVIAHLI